MKMFSKLSNPDGMLNKVCDLIIGVFLVGFFTVVCSLPIVTIGISLTSGYYTMAKVVRHNEGYVWREFFKAFGRNFKSGIGLTIGYLIAAAIIVYDVIYLKGQSDELSDIMILIIIAVGLMYITTLFFVFFELSRFDKKGFQIFKFGIITTFRHFPSALGVAGMFGLAGLLVWLMPWGFCIFPGLAMFGSTFLMERVMRKYMPVPEPGSEEADKWYYR